MLPNVSKAVGDSGTSKTKGTVVDASEVGCLQVRSVPNGGNCRALS